MNTLIVALRYLQQRKVRTLLTTVAILFGVAVVYGTNAMFPAMNTALEQSTLPPDDPRLRIMPGSTAGSTDFELATDIPALLAVEGIEAVTPRVVLHGSTIVTERAPLGTDITGVDPAGEKLSDFPLEAGRFLQAGDRRALVLTSFIAQVGAFEVGESIELFPGETYEVVGVLAADHPFGSVYIPLAEAQAAAQMEGMANRLLLTIAPDMPVMTIVAALDTVFGAFGYGFEQGINLSNAALSNTFMNVIFNIFGGLALFVGAFLIYITFTTAVIERRRDLAMLRAIGAEQGQLTRLMTLEALLQGVTGTVAGVIVGQLFAIGMLQLLWNTSYRHLEAPASIPLHLPSLLIAVTVGLLTALLAGYFPARAAGRVSPLEALRPTSTVEVRRVAMIRIIAGVVPLAAGILLLGMQDRYSGLAALALLVSAVLLVPVVMLPVTHLLLPLVRLLFPRTADVIRASVVRQPWRTAATVNLMTIGFAVFTGVMALFSPILANTIEMVNSQRPDADLVLWNGDPINVLDAAFMDRLNAIPNIEVVSTVNEASAMVDGVEAGVLLVDPEQSVRMRYFSILDGTGETPSFRSPSEVPPLVQQLSTGNNAIISVDLSSRLGRGIGDTITLETASGSQRYTIIALGMDFSQEHGDRTITIAQNPQAFPDTTITSVMIGFADDAQGHATQAAIMNTLLVDYPSVYMEDVSARRAQMIGDAERGLSIFYVLAALVLIPSMIGLLNTLIMSVLERTREIGVLRATGANRGHIRSTIIGEGLLLGLVSAVIGIAVGMGMGRGLLSTLQALNQSSTPYIFNLSPVGFTLALAAGIGLILLATVLPARRAARLDILDALRYE